MTISCGFFDSVNKDRLYKAEEMTRPYELLVSNGVFATPKGTPSTYLQVYADSGMKVVVRPGRGIFKDKWFINDSDLLLTISPAEINLTRVDAIVVRIDTSEDVRAGTIEIKKGTPASEEEAKAPDMERTLDVHEYKLASIKIKPEVTQIEQANITDERGGVDCGWVTSLVNQMDTTTLFEQWKDAYNTYYEQVETDFETYYNDNKSRFDAYYNQVVSSFDSFMSSSRSSFDTYYAENKSRFDSYYSSLESKYNTYYNQQVSRFDAQYNSNQTKFNTQYDNNQDKFDAQYDNNQTDFENQYNSNQSTFDKQCTDNQAEFDALFNEMTSTTGSLTMSVNTGYYKTTKAGETTVAVTPDFNYLSVYINGLHAVPNLDYTLSGKTITLTKGVLAGTIVSYVAFKQGSA